MKIKEIKLEIGQKMKDIQIMKNKENERYPSCTENDKMIDIQLEEDRKWRIFISKYDIITSFHFHQLNEKAENERYTPW